MKKSYLILLALVILGAGAFFLFGGKRQTSNFSQNQAPTQVAGSFVKGQKAPDVTLIDFDGGLHKLSDFKGKAVVLDFWAAWCPFCIAEMPQLQAAQDKYGDDLVMIGVHRTDTENKDTGLKFANEGGVSYLLVSDSDGSLYRASGGFGMPTAIFIDQKGIVKEIKTGPKTDEEIEEKISSLVGEES